MPSITLDPELYRRVAEIAGEKQANVDDLLAEAVRAFLWEQQRQRISEETQTYRRRHAQIKAHYLGQYIAMHNGEVVDHDPDFSALRQRVRRQFKHIPVMITQVGDSPISPIMRRGFRLETESE